MKQKQRQTVLFLLFTFAVLPLYAQTVEVIEVDSNKGITKTNFPYDQEFFVKLVYETKPSISYIEVIEGKKDYKSFSIINPTTGLSYIEQRLEFKTSATLAVIINLKIIPVEKKFEVLIPMPRLRPDKDYDLVIHSFLSDKETNDYIIKGFLDQYNSTSLFAISPSNLANQALVSSSPIKPVTVFKNKQLSTTPVLPSYIMTFGSDYRIKIGATYVLASVPLGKYHAVPFGSAIGQLQQTEVLTAIDDLLNQIKVDVMKTDTQSVVPTRLQLALTTLKQIGESGVATNFDNYATGRKSLIDFPHMAAETALSNNPDTTFKLLEKLISNLSSSIEVVAQLRLYSQATYINDPNQKDLVSFCSDLIAKMQQRQDALVELTDTYNKLTDEMQTDKRLVSNDNISQIRSSSRVFGIETRGKVQILPDFGLAYYSAISNPADSKQLGYNHRNFNGFAPFIGLNVSIAPINKDIPLRALRGMPGKTLRRFSLFVGVTLNSIAKDNERKDLIGSKSLLTGLSFRLSNAIRLSTGALMFNAKSPNPVINEYHFSAVPYVALSLDISLRGVLKDVTGLLSPLLN